MRRDVFQAIADPTRREILTLLAHKQLNLNAVADNFDISRPAVSKHIKILTECGLVVIKQQGASVFAMPVPRALAPCLNGLTSLGGFGWINWMR